jgi:hypothetical protein
MAGKAGQRGISLITLVFIVAVLGGVGLIGMKAFPSVLEYQAAVKAINKARDANSVVEARNAFDRAAQIDNITSISGKDLNVVKDGEQLVVSFAYDKDFHMFGPAYLLLKYEATSRPGR